MFVHKMRHNQQADTGSKRSSNLAELSLSLTATIRPKVETEEHAKDKQARAYIEQQIQ